MTTQLNMFTGEDRVWKVAYKFGDGRIPSDDVQETFEFKAKGGAEVHITVAPYDDFWTWACGYSTKNPICGRSYAPWLSFGNRASSRHAAYMAAVDEVESSTTRVQMRNPETGGRDGHRENLHTLQILPLVAKARAYGARLR